MDRLQVGIQSQELTPSKKNPNKSSSEPNALTIAYNRFHTNHFPYAYSWMAYGNGFVINLLYVFSSNTKENVNNLVIWAQQTPDYSSYRGIVITNSNGICKSSDFEKYCAMMGDNHAA